MTATSINFTLTLEILKKIRKSRQKDLTIYSISFFGTHPKHDLFKPLHLNCLVMTGYEPTSPESVFVPNTQGHKFRTVVPVTSRSWKRKSLVPVAWLELSKHSKDLKSDSFSRYFYRGLAMSQASSARHQQILGKVPVRFLVVGT